MKAPIHEILRESGDGRTVTEDKPAMHERAVPSRASLVMAPDEFHRPRRDDALCEPDTLKRAGRGVRRGRLA
ncbi:hypothetical protein [Frankia tisae]|uniref:hypothetical protein n=1 Tax=Frankia tisae TaxID=2950104 RepID=UPI0021BF6E79|nr:hypothetical protein [Frankia tisae]